MAEVGSVVRCPQSLIGVNVDGRCGTLRGSPHLPHSGPYNAPGGALHVVPGHCQSGRVGEGGETTTEGDVCTDIEDVIEAGDGDAFCCDHA